MTRKRITVSLPEDVATAVQEAVAAGEAPDASAFVARAVRRYRRRLTPAETEAALAREYGQFPPEADAWARRVLGLDHAATR